MNHIETEKESQLSEAARKLQFPESEGATSFEELCIKIKSYSHLKNGWDGNYAEAPNQESIRMAISALEKFNHAKILPSSVGPSVENGIGFTFESGNKYCFIEFFNDGAACALTNTGGLGREAWEFNSNVVAELQSVIQRFVLHLRK